MLLPRNRNTRGIEGTTTKITGNLLDNWITVVSLDSALSITIILCSCKFMSVAPEALIFLELDSRKLLPSRHPIYKATVLWRQYVISGTLFLLFSTT